MPLLKRLIIGKGIFIFAMLSVAGFGIYYSHSSAPEPVSWALPIVPHPQEIRLKDERQSFILNQHTRLLICPYNENQDSLDLQFVRDKLATHNLNRLETIRANSPPDTNNIIIILGKKQLSPLLSGLLSRKGLGFSKDYPGQEGYILEVTPNYVLLVGNDQAGKFYGIQSLLQLLFRDVHTGQMKIRASTIVDYADMPLRSAFYGFYLNAMEDDSLISRAYHDFEKIARYKFNMIDLASHHYGHLEMEIPGHPQEKLWQRFAKLHEAARRLHLQPRVGGWAKWVNTHSPWGVDLTTLECIRTTQNIKLSGNIKYILKITSGQTAPNVIYNLDTGKSWEKEPVVVTNQSGTKVYKENKDYLVNFAKIRSENYQKFENTQQTNLEVLFSKLHYGEGEPEGFPLREAETFNAPTTIQRVEGGRIQDGQTVKVSFSYIGADPYSLIKVHYCRSDERLHIDGPENYIWRWCTDPIRFWGASDFCLDVDETRVLAFDKRCMDSGKTRSQIWADDILYYYQTIRKANPRARICLWSDMLDPAHNAKIYKTDDVATLLKMYGLMDITMIPWNDDFAEESVQFFSKKGFPIMPSCQGWNEQGISDAPLWAWLVRKYYGSKRIPCGLMHCRWGYGFDSGITWEQLATVADHAWSIAPYIVHTPIYFAPLGKPVKISAKYEGDQFVFDGKKITRGPLPLKEAILSYRQVGKSNFKRLKMLKKNNSYYAIIPSITDTSSDIEYYIAMSDQFHTSFCPGPGMQNSFKIKFQKESRKK